MTPDRKIKNLTDEKFTAAIDDTLDRVCLLRSIDTAHARSKNKKEVKQVLEKYVAALNHRYGQPSSSYFPSSVEWGKLQTLCFQLAKLYGKAKTSFGEWDKAITLIDGKYKTLGVRDFIEKIIGRIKRLPVPPCTHIDNILQQCADDTEKAQLQEIYKALRSKLWPLDVGSKQWDKWVELIGKPGIQIENNPNALSLNKGIDQPTAYCLVRKIHCQQQKWMMDYDDSTRATLKWIYLLNNDAYFQSLKKIFHGSALDPGTMKKILGKHGNRRRKNRFDRKNRIQR